MRFSYTTRLDSSMSATTLNATVLSSMAELCNVLDGSTKLDHTNLNPRARLYSGQLGTMDGDRFALAADGFGVPTEALKDGAVTATPMAATTVSHRALATQAGQRGVRILLGGTKTGILRGHSKLSLAGGSSAASLTIDWTTSTAYTGADEVIPAGWTTPLSMVRVVAYPAVYDSDTVTANYCPWIQDNTPSAGHMTIACLTVINSPTDTGFTARIVHADWDKSAHTSSAYTTGTRVFFFSWIAVVKYT